jgi:arylsulfatase B
MFKANNYPLHGSKLTTFEGGVRVVACVRWPAHWKGGRKLENTMGYIDVLPTILKSAGVDPLEGQVAGRELDGVSLCDLLAGTKADFPERDWYSYHGQNGEDKETIAIKTAQWKLIITGPDIRESAITDNHNVFLYRMPDDLLEKHNLADRQPDVVKDLFAKLQAYRSLQPKNGVTTFRVGRKGFKPWKDWRVEPPK